TNDPWGASLCQQLVSRVRAHITGSVPTYMVPADVVVLDELPLTENGKIDRRALPTPESFRQTRQTYVAPQTATEEILIEIWKQVLNLDQIGVEDNFVELGGHSLLGMKLVTRMAEQFSMQFLVLVIFKHPTVRDMAQYIDRKLSDTTADSRSNQVGL